MIKLYNIILHNLNTALKQNQDRLSYKNTFCFFKYICFYIHMYRQTFALFLILHASEAEFCAAFVPESLALTFRYYC